MTRLMFMAVTLGAARDRRFSIPDRFAHGQVRATGEPPRRPAAARTPVDPVANSAQPREVAHVLRHGDLVMPREVHQGCPNSGYQGLGHSQSHDYPVTFATAENMGGPSSRGRSRSSGSVPGCLEVPGRVPVAGGLPLSALRRAERGPVDRAAAATRSGW